MATNKSIQPSLLMSVATTPHAFPSDFADSGRLRYVGESPVTVVAEEPTAGRGIHRRQTVITLLSLLITAEFVSRTVEIYEAANEEIEPLSLSMSGQRQTALDDHPGRLLTLFRRRP